MDNQKKEITKIAYNNGAALLSEKFNEMGPRITDVERACFLCHVKNPVVLEVGCGNGRDAKVIAEHTDQYVGIDISEEMIRLSREYLPHLSFSVADIETYILPDTIDLVFAFASFLHLSKESLAAVLMRLHQKLSAHGVVYLSVKYDSYREYIKEDEFGSRVFYFYDEHDMDTLAKAAGFEVIYFDRQNLKGNDWMTIALKKQP